MTQPAPKMISRIWQQSLPVTTLTMENDTLLRLFTPVIPPRQRISIDSTSFGTVANTTQYLVDDWNAYLASHGLTATEYTVPADPIQAAADIATKSWTSAPTAVVAVDGSGFNDTVSTVVQKTATLTRNTAVQNISCT